MAPQFKEIPKSREVSGIHLADLKQPCLRVLAKHEIVADLEGDLSYAQWFPNTIGALDTQLISNVAPREHARDTAEF
jgi:hypothetical protein